MTDQMEVTAGGTQEVDPREAARALLQYASTLPTPTIEGVRSRYVAAVTAAVLAGEPVPADLAHELTVDRTAVDAANDLRAVLLAAVKDLNATADQRERDRMPERFLYLNRRVQEIRAAVVEHAATLGPVRSASAAMKAGDAQVTAWRALEGLAHEYAEIRAEQVGLAVKAGSPKIVVTADVVAKYGIMRDVDQLWPGRADLVLGRGHTLTNGPVSVAPWPHRGGDPWQIEHGVDFLLWAHDVNAELWVPTGQQLQAAAEQASKVVARRRAELAAPVERKQENATLRWHRAD